MPHVRIEMLKGKSAQYKEAIFDGIHRAIVDELKTPAEDRYQRIIEIDSENFDHGPRRSDDYLFIEIMLFEGRSEGARAGAETQFLPQAGDQCRADRRAN